MKFKKVLALLLFVSLNIFAQNPQGIEPQIIEPNLNNPKLKIYSGKDVGIKASDILDSTWYTTFYIKKFREAGIFEKFNEFKKSIPNIGNISFDEIPDEIDNISIYGNSIRQTIKILLIGDFSQVKIEDFIENKLYTKNNISQLKTTKSRRFGRRKNYVYSLKDSDKKIYAKKIHDKLIIVSDNVINEHAVLSKTVGRLKENKLNRSTLITLNIDAQQIHKSAESNIDKNNYIIQSQLFKKTNHIVARVQLIDENIIIGSALVAKNNETAVQIEKILNGITAYNSMTDVQESVSAQSKLMKNLVIERNENNVHIGTFISLNNLIKSNPSTEK